MVHGGKAAGFGGVSCGVSGGEGGVLVAVGDLVELRLGGLGQG